MSRKLTWFEYYIGHCLQTGWREMWNNFKMWRDLLSGNYEGYALLDGDDPYEECYNWFWSSINLDECYDKEFIEYLQDLVDKIESGEEKLIPLTESFIVDLKDLVGDTSETGTMDSIEDS